jgi:hypothetical protein
MIHPWFFAQQDWADVDVYAAGMRDDALTCIADHYSHFAQSARTADHLSSRHLVGGKRSTRPSRSNVMFTDRHGTTMTGADH